MITRGRLLIFLSVFFIIGMSISSGDIIKIIIGISLFFAFIIIFKYDDKDVRNQIIRSGTTYVPRTEQNNPYRDVAEKEWDKTSSFHSPEDLR